jgi:hypothetical protein
MMAQTVRVLVVLPVCSWSRHCDPDSAVKTSVVLPEPGVGLHSHRFQQNCPISPEVIPAKAGIQSKLALPVPRGESDFIGPIFSAAAGSADFAILTGATHI